jgi:hypothetical protein
VPVGASDADLQEIGGHDVTVGALFSKRLGAPNRLRFNRCTRVDSSGTGPRRTMAKPFQAQRRGTSEV